jgi:hypothetical protein
MSRVGGTLTTLCILVAPTAVPTAVRILPSTSSSDAHASPGASFRWTKSRIAATLKFQK